MEEHNHVTVSLCFIVACMNVEMWLFQVDEILYLCVVCGSHVEVAECNSLLKTSFSGRTFHERVQCKLTKLFVLVCSARERSNV